MVQSYYVQQNYVFQVYEIRHPPTL